MKNIIVDNNILFIVRNNMFLASEPVYHVIDINKPDFSFCKVIYSPTHFRITRAKADERNESESRKLIESYNIR
jgi:hypothetical protein